MAIKSPTKHCRSVGVDVFVRVNCGKKPLMKYLQGINKWHKTRECDGCIFHCSFLAV